MGARAKVIFVVIAVVVGLGMIVAISLRPQPPEIVAWRTDLSAAQDEAAANHKKVFIDFTAEWCGPCQELRHTTWASQAVADALADYVPVSIDIDKQAALAQHFNVQGIPHFVVLDGSTVTRESEGALDPDAFVKWLKTGASE